TGAVHLALTLGMTPGSLKADDEVLVRVHEPLSVMDWLDAGSRAHSWPLAKALAQIREAGRGVAVLLNVGDDSERLLEQLLPAPTEEAPKAAMDLRTYGVGAQILKALGVHRMRLLGNQRRMPSMVGFGLEVTGFLTADGQSLPPGH
ncbi:MAG TPA: bifunctional 3,4-dihydroxy-2-butanone-4-phosphate synthase/GTP cyclohydrolase II, partial [Aquabacterium sp.]|nr:bifunctional 3,4-dihydroxy-2-butanone-4-phosphate synthase/GTP cyclohydrolase II [Aquabacterium sp.]